MTTLADLVQPYTADQIREAVYTGIAESGVTTTSWKPGAVTRTIIAVLAIIVAAFSQLISLVAKGGFLDLSEKDWLTAKAKYDYDVDRIPGAFATGIVTLTNTAGGVFGRVQPGDLVVANEVTNALYTNTAEFSLNAVTTVAQVPVQAVEIGTASNANPGEITKVVSTMSGVTCTNAVALLGLDQEEDEPLRTRCRQKTGSLSPNGPHDAYSYFARSATRADGSTIGINRVRTIPDGLGGIDVYVATAGGNVVGDADDPATDLGIVNALLQALAVPNGITLRTHSASLHTIAVTYEIWVRSSGLSDIAVKQKIESALATYLSGTPIGGELYSGSGFVYLEALKPVFGTALPGLVINLALFAPSANVSISPTQAPVLGTVVPTVHFYTEVTS